MKKQHLQLRDEDRDVLASLVKKGITRVRTLKRAMGLLELDRGKTLRATAESLGVNYNTVAAWRDAYATDGLTFLTDKPRSGRPVRIDGVQRAKITALACSTPPEGRARWSLRLLADKAVELDYCTGVSAVQVGKILKKTM